MGLTWGNGDIVTGTQADGKWSKKYCIVIDKKNIRDEWMTGHFRLIILITIGNNYSSIIKNFRCIDILLPLNLQGHINMSASGEFGTENSSKGREMQFVDQSLLLSVCRDRCGNACTLNFVTADEQGWPRDFQQIKNTKNPTSPKINMIAGKRGKLFKLL